MSHSKKILLVLGAGGMLGSEFTSFEYLPEWEVLCHGRTSEMAGYADLSKVDQTSSMLAEIRPNAILNLVGLTNVDLCESSPNEAYIGNVKTLENVVTWIKRTDKPVQLIHISTDQVYDGTGPHSEDSVCLKNYYAFSKYAGELVARSVNGAVLRTNFFGKSKCDRRASLTDWIYSSLKANKEIKVFEDVMFSPLSMESVCENISFVLKNSITGVYNLGSRQGLSKAEFAYRFALSLDLNTKPMSRSSTSDADFLITYRPKDMRLNVNKFESMAGILLPDLTEEIERVVGEYKI